MRCDHLRPEKFGMVFCPDCHGSGRDEDGEGPCQKCAGFGWLIGNETHAQQSCVETLPD